MAEIRLTQFAHGGGCGCKLAPNVLQDLLSEQLARPSDERLLVGNESSDDAAAWLLNDDDCILATTDFFTPIVDDPYEFGRIAATNAISDIYAMGGRPVMALALLGVPVDKLPADTIRSILRGGADVCAAAGIPVAGGHSIDAPEPIYGLAVTGLCKLSSLRRNSQARPDDAVILTKPLGIGIYSAALKKGVLDAVGYETLIETTTQLNQVGADLGLNPHVHAITDVTGFGLAGHALEIAKASGVGIELTVSALPLLSQAESLARQEVVTGSYTSNLLS
jgi:selenide,water dikinase